MQPLYAPGVKFVDGLDVKYHDLVIVATEFNSVFAFDAGTAALCNLPHIRVKLALVQPAASATHLFTAYHSAPALTAALLLHRYRGPNMENSINDRPRSHRK